MTRTRVTRINVNNSYSLYINIIYVIRCFVLNAPWLSTEEMNAWRVYMKDLETLIFLRVCSRMYSVHVQCIMATIHTTRAVQSSERIEARIALTNYQITKLKLHLKL